MSIMERLSENGISALVIWITFGISILMAYIYQRVRLYRSNSNEMKIKPMSKLGQYLWTSIIIIAPSLIIGLRSFSVGADTQNYVVGYLRSGSSFAIQDLLGVNQLYNLFRFIVHYISNGNPTIFLFIFVFITLFILVRALDKWIDKFSISFALFIYYAVLAMQLFNQARQMLAISIILYAIPYIFEKKSLKYYALIIIASLFHFTAIIGIFFPIFKFVKTRYYKVKKWFYYSLWVFVPFILPYLIRATALILPDSYTHYVTEINKMDIGFGLILSIIPVFVPLLFMRRKIIGEKSEFFSRIAILTLPFRLAGYYSYYLMRLQYYGIVSIIFLIPLSIQNYKSKSYRKTIKILLIMLFIAYYVVVFIYLNDSKIFPYKTVYSPY